MSYAYSSLETSLAFEAALFTFLLICIVAIKDRQSFVGSWPGKHERKLPAIPKLPTPLAGFTIKRNYRFWLWTSSVQRLQSQGSGSRELLSSRYGLLC
jgi:hypothetical protein